MVNKQSYVRSKQDLSLDTTHLSFIVIHAVASVMPRECQINICFDPKHAVLHRMLFFIHLISHL